MQSNHELFDSTQPAYTELRSKVAERSARLLVLTGAGLSRSAGIPSWLELKNALIKVAEEKASTIKSDGPSEREGLVGLAKVCVDAWQAFTYLKKALGDTTYVSTVRSSLTARDEIEIPYLYKKLWELPVSGIINLNLDRLTTRAFAARYGGQKTLPEFVGKNAGEYHHILGTNINFVCNVHGTAEDASSWVFTVEDLAELGNNPGYKSLIRSAFSQFTVLFIGVTADDKAISSHLEDLRQQGIRVGPHYWFTDRLDDATDAWAEKSGIRVIRYDSRDGSHDGLRQAIEGLLDFQPTEEPVSAKPVLPFHRPQEKNIPAAGELSIEEPELIRLVLNDHATQLLEKESPEAYDSYMAFLDDYERPIYNASFVSTSPGNNVVFGYKVEREVGQGGFGKVYLAKDPKGKKVAIKVLLDNVRREHSTLTSFRRGVSSMKILKDRHAPGVVEYLEAAEIPPMVVMEWVEGENLRQAVSRGRVNEWKDLLRIGSELTEILVFAHSLPERVLHRDLRPANIMLESRGHDDYRVRLLDFDLSWYRGAYEQTLIHEKGATGYLAPEQIHRERGVSTRSTAVDTFGLGMTLYFMMSGSDPVADQHLHRNWKKLIDLATDEVNPPKWLATRRRMERLVFDATLEEQSERPDMFYMRTELRRLLQLENSYREPVTDFDIAVEEIAARSDAMQGYRWHSDQLLARTTSASGIELEARANLSRNRMSLKALTSLNKNSNHRRVNQVKDDVERIFGKIGWKVNFNVTPSEFSITATSSSSASIDSSTKAATAMDKVVQALASY